MFLVGFVCSYHPVLRAYRKIRRRNKIVEPFYPGYYFGCVSYQISFLLLCVSVLASVVDNVSLGSIPFWSPLGAIQLVELIHFAMTACSSVLLFPEANLVRFLL